LDRRKKGGERTFGRRERKRSRVLCRNDQGNWKQARRRKSEEEVELKTKPSNRRQKGGGGQAELRELQLKGRRAGNTRHQSRGVRAGREIVEKSAGGLTHSIAAAIRGGGKKKASKRRGHRYAKLLGERAGKKIPSQARIYERRARGGGEAQGKRGKESLSLQDREEGKGEESLCSKEKKGREEERLRNGKK